MMGTTFRALRVAVAVAVALAVAVRDSTTSDLGGKREGAADAVNFDETFCRERLVLDSFPEDKLGEGRLAVALTPRAEVFVPKLDAIMDIKMIINNEDIG